MSFFRFSLSFFTAFLLTLTASAKLYPLDAVNTFTPKPEIIFSEEEKEAIKNKPVINVVINPDWAPLEFNEDKTKKTFTASGINVEFLKQIADSLGVKINFIPTSSYAQSIDFILEGKADVISGYTRLLDKYEQIRQSIGTYNIQLMLVSSTGQLPKEGDTIAINQFPSELLEKLRAEIGIKNLKFEICAKPEITLSKFVNKEVDFALITQAELSYSDKIPEHKIYNLALSYNQQFAFSTSLDPHFIKAFNKVLKTFSVSDLNLIFYKLLKEKKLQNIDNLAKKEQIDLKRMHLLACSLFIALVMIIIVLIMLKHKLHEITYDDLTGLYTYSRFRRDVSKLLKKHKNESYMFLCLNIDNFGFINDSYGFSYGDKILERISAHFIEESSKGEKYCRYYGDTFIFFLKNPKSMTLIEDKVFKLTDVTSHIEDMLPKKYSLTFTSGVYYVNANDDFNDITGMVTKANIARKLSKNNFLTHRTAEYTNEMKKANDWNREITLSMNKALENNEFIVYYQPKFSLKTGKVIGAEALIRWNKPEMGIIGPDKFIPLFEHNGFIEKIDIYVFADVCRFINRWTHFKDGKCPYPITISFNLSRYHLYDTDLIEKLTNISRKFDIDNKLIEVELTESIMFDNMKRLVKVMNDIKNAGFKISVDDFGSGYSSLNVLKNMPADIIKLDKEFLPEHVDSRKDGVIIESVINMAKKLNMQTVAEGIETKEQSELLEGIGCDIAQGYYFARPMTSDAFFELLKKYI